MPDPGALLVALGAMVANLMEGRPPLAHAGGPAVVGEDRDRRGLLGAGLGPHGEHGDQGGVVGRIAVEGTTPADC